MTLLFRCAYNLVVFCVLLSGCAYAQEKRARCIQEEPSLTCLKNNFNEFYTQSYGQFWDIAHQAARDAKKCDSSDDTSSFLDLVQIKTNNAEFNAFYKEVIEQLVIENTNCFLVAVARLDSDSQRKIMERLRYPIFVERTAIENALLGESNDQYKSILDMYFDQNN